MINVVGRRPLAAAGVRLCTFEHVLCDTSSMPCDWLPCHTAELREEAMVNGTVPITLENLGQIRRDPCCSAENFVLDSCDDAARELESAFGGASEIWNDTEMTDSSTDASVAVVCDLTTVDEGRDVDGLARVAARLGDGVAVCFGASLDAASVARDAVLPGTLLQQALERQLVVGVDVAADVTRNFAAGAPAAQRAAFVGPLRPAFTWDGKIHSKSADFFYVHAAAAVASRRGAPVVVVLPAGDRHDLERRARSVLAIAAQPGLEPGYGLLGPIATPPTWIFRAARLDDLADLTQAVLHLGENVFAVADGWDRPCDRGPPPPRVRDWNVDARLFPMSRVLVGAGVRYRTQLRKYGGAGYDAGIKTVCDAGYGSASWNEAAPRLAWYRPPKKRPADVVELQCSRCGRSFEVRRGHHYGKYDFVYCGRACLDAHRDAGFDASEATGPTASAQGV